MPFALVALAVASIVAPLLAGLAPTAGWSIKSRVAWIAAWVLVGSCLVIASVDVVTYQHAIDAGFANTDGFDLGNYGLALMEVRIWRTLARSVGWLIPLVSFMVGWAIAAGFRRRVQRAGQA